MDISSVVYISYTILTRFYVKSCIDPIAKTRKIFALIGALITGGLGIVALTSAQTAQALSGNN
jgi:hypothetical protein